MYVCELPTLQAIGNLSLSELGPLATDAQLRLAGCNFVYMYAPHESQTDGTLRRLAEANEEQALQTTTELELASYAWFVPTATRSSAELLLQGMAPRTFLVRPGRRQAQVSVLFFFFVGPNF